MVSYYIQIIVLVLFLIDSAFRSGNIYDYQHNMGLNLDSPKFNEIIEKVKAKSALEDKVIIVDQNNKNEMNEVKENLMVGLIAKEIEALEIDPFSEKA